MKFSRYDERTIEVARYISATGSTVRAAAARFYLSKSTVHKDMTTRLRDLDAELFEKVRACLNLNKAERHLRGGMATKRKYRAMTDKVE